MKRRGLLWTVSIVTTFVVVIVIFRFSAQSATESNRLSKDLAENLMRMFPVLEDVITVNKLNHYLRKSAHFILYFILGCGLTGVVSKQKGKQKKIALMLISILVGVFFAAIDEAHQLFSDSRGPMVQDVLLDTCGVAAGSLFLAIFSDVVCSKEEINLENKGAKDKRCKQQIKRIEK